MPSYAVTPNQLERLRCPTCGGDKVVDSGGQDQAGNWIDIPCPDCNGEGVERSALVEVENSTRGRTVAVHGPETQAVRNASGVVGRLAERMNADDGLWVWWPEQVLPDDGELTIHPARMERLMRIDGLTKGINKVRPDIAAILHIDGDEMRLEEA